MSFSRAQSTALAKAILELRPLNSAQHAKHKTTMPIPTGVHIILMETIQTFLEKSLMYVKNFIDTCSTYDIHVKQQL